MTILRISERIALRPVAEDDAEAFYALVDANRERLAEWMPWAAASTFEETRRFTVRAREQAERDDGFQAAVVVDGEIAGLAGFHGIDRVNRATKLGYWLAARYEGRGVMTAAVAALLDHAFGPWDLHRAEIEAAVGNRRSRAVAERLGFAHEATLRDSQLVGGRFHDGALYAMLAPDWRRRREHRGAGFARSG